MMGMFGPSSESSGVKIVGIGVVSLEETEIAGMEGVSSGKAMVGIGVPPLGASIWIDGVGMPRDDEDGVC